MENIVNNFNNIIENLSLCIKGIGYSLINDIEEINIDIFNRRPLSLLITENGTESVVIIINAVISTIIIYFVLKSILSLYSSTSIGNIYYLGIRIIIVAIFSINSFYICKEIIKINSMFTEIITSMLQEIADEEIEYRFLEENINSIDELLAKTDKENINVIKDIILCSYLLFLIVFFCIRYVVVILCIIISPIALMCNVSNNMKKYFRFWLKVFVLNLSVQIINRIIMFIPISSKSEEESYCLILIGSIFVMYSVNKAIGEMILNGKNK